MHDLSFQRRIFYTYLSHQYWFTHYTSTHTLLGIHLSTVLKSTSILLIMIAWLDNWSTVPLSVCILLLVWIYFSYWTGKRAGYYKFVPDNTIPLDYDGLVALPPYERIAVAATGVFSLHDWEKSVLFLPAEYWQVPRGDHAVMVEHKPRKYLYQFVSMEKLEDLQRGWLLYGRHPHAALAISFESIWGPEFSQLQFSIFGSVKSASEPKSRTIYLSFFDAETEAIICQNIIGHRQRQRSTTIDKT